MTLLEETIAAHGGSGAWSALGAVELSLDAHGLAFASKGRSSALRGLRARVATSGQHVVLEDFPRGSGGRGVLAADGARLEDAAGRVSARAVAARGARWSPVDVLAFAGAALWSYVSFPFALADWDVEELPGRRLRVRVPPGVRSHAREHVLWIGDDCLIRRQDYTAEAFGRWARAANVCTRHDTVGGVVLATRRRVTPRVLGRPAPGPVLVSIELRP